MRLITYTLDEERASVRCAASAAAAENTVVRDTGERYIR